MSERGRDALAHHVFDSVTPARLVKLSRLGERRLVPCEEIARGFFRYFAFTKLWSAQAVRAAIAKGVERGEFAYGVGVETDGDTVRAADRSLVHVDTAVPADEVDLGEGAALLTVDVARDLLAPTGDGASGAGLGAATTTEEGSPIARGDSTASASPCYTVALSISATGTTLHDLQRALTGLRSLAGDLQIEVTARGTAQTPEGIDQTRFQNAVRQHLEEAGLDFKETWSAAPDDERK